MTGNETRGEVVSVRVTASEKQRLEAKAALYGGPLADYAAGAHRAKDDVLSLIELLDHVCADGESIMAKVLDAIDAPAWRFEATWASYHQRDLLRDRRYRWRSEGRSGVWHKHIRADQYQSEWEWHLGVIGHEPSVIPLPATERYRHDRSWKPVERKAKITA